MDRRCLLLVFVLLTPNNAWNNLNCPAPRAPDNGLSFIFRDGELVHFRCHPGYLMRGKPVAYCVKNEWTEPSPECLPLRKMPLQVASKNDAYPSNIRTDKQGNDYKGQFFYWGERSTPRRGIYGEGPRRLPLINGIWPPEDSRHRDGPLNLRSGPGPKEVVREEIDIAELRQKQLEELKGHRYAHRRRPHHQKRKSQSVPPAHSPALHNRPSRVDTHSQSAASRSNTLLELGSRPEERVRSSKSFIARADASCVERLYGREVPMRAPQVPNAFVFRYETQRNPNFPYNSYMLVKYRCLNGHVLANPKAEALYCKEAEWVGEVPRCQRFDVVKRTKSNLLNGEDNLVRHN